MADTYMLTLVEVQLPRIIQKTQGRIHLTLSDLDGEDVDLTDFDVISLACKNYPEEDESITKTCSVNDDNTTQCYFDFTVADSTGWLAAPYFAEITLKRFVRDKKLIEVTANTGYIPEKAYMSFETCTHDFEVGETITGADSGTTAVVWAYEEYGGIGELELVQVSGAFNDGEEITSPGGGTAYVVVGISSTEYIADRFADDSKDFVALGVRVGDELLLDGTRYVITGFDETIGEWLTLEEEVEDPDTSLDYIVYTWDLSTSATDYLYKTLPFVLYVDSSLA